MHHKQGYIDNALYVTTLVHYTPYIYIPISYNYYIKAKLMYKYIVTFVNSQVVHINAYSNIYKIMLGPGDIKYHVIYTNVCNYYNI